MQCQNHLTPTSPDLQLTQPSLADTPLVRFGVGPSTLEKPLGTEFKLSIGLVAYSSTLLRTYFGAANLADYILPGHGTLKSHLGKSTPATAELDGNEKIHKVMNLDTGISKASDNVRHNESL